MLNSCTVVLCVGEQEMKQELKTYYKNKREIMSCNSQIELSHVETSVQYLTLHPDLKQNLYEYVRVRNQHLLAVNKK